MKHVIFQLKYKGNLLIDFFITHCGKKTQLKTHDGFPLVSNTTHDEAHSVREIPRPVLMGNHSNQAALSQAPVLDLKLHFSLSKVQKQSADSLHYLRNTAHGCSIIIPNARLYFKAIKRRTIFCRSLPLNYLSDDTAIR